VHNTLVSMNYYFLLEIRSNHLCAKQESYPEIKANFRLESLKRNIFHE
jgi:hypothetical protein